VLAAAVLLLSGCGTFSGPGLPAGLEPIAAPVTLGNVPVAEATLHQRETIVGYKRGYSGSIVIESEIEVDLQRGGPCLYLRTEVVDVDSRFTNIIESWTNIYRMIFAAREGQEVWYEVDLDTAEVTASMLKPEPSLPTTGDKSLVFNILLAPLHLGGETVAQGQELLRYRLGDLIPGLPADEAELTYTLKAVGRTVIEGRATVIARAEGHVWGDDAPMTIDQVVHFDEATGVALHSEAEFRSLPAKDANRLRIVQDLDLESAARTAGDSRGAARPEPLAHCQVAI
jgi:hypothetical protein